MCMMKHITLDAMRPADVFTHVLDSLPPTPEDSLVYVWVKLSDGSVMKVHYGSVADRPPWFLDWDDWGIHNKVTHWMPFWSNHD